MISVDIFSNRKQVKWTRNEKIGRVIWALAWPCFRFSPRPFWGWRRHLLRAFGSHIGAEVHIYPTVIVKVPWNLEIGDYTAIGDRVILYALGTIQIGSKVTVSQGAHLCAGTHDYRDASMPLLKEPIAVGDGAWICADAYIGPNTRIGAFAIVGARAVAVKDVQAHEIVAGNPARRIGMRQ